MGIVRSICTKLPCFVSAFVMYNMDFECKIYTQKIIDSFVWIILNDNSKMELSDCTVDGGYGSCNNEIQSSLKVGYTHSPSIELCRNGIH